VEGVAVAGEAIAGGVYGWERVYNLYDFEVADFEYGAGPRSGTFSHHQQHDSKQKYKRHAFLYKP
jgi:hypothetical protein